jgi:hypothetical protein
MSSGRDDDQSGDAAPTQTLAAHRLSAFTVLKYNCLGVPISLKHLPYEWREVVPGAFPLAFSFFAALMAAVLAGFGFLYSSWPCYARMTLRDFFGESWSIFRMAFLWQVVFNSVLFCHCALVLYLWNRFTKGGAECSRGAQRVVYFSSFWVSVTVFVWTLEWAVYNGAVIPAALMGFGLFVVFPIALVLRVLSIFQGVRRETQGSIPAAGLSLVGAVDLWLAPFLLMLVWGLLAYG